MIQSYAREILVWRDIHDGFENSAKMKRAYQAMLGELLQRNIIGKIFKNICPGVFNCRQMVLFQRMSNQGHIWVMS